MSDIIVSQRTKYEVICPECGAKIKLNCNIDYSYCPVCTSRIQVNDAKRGNLSKDLIEALSGSELDAIIRDANEIDIDKLEIASRNGSVVATIKAGSYYLSKSDYTNAKTYFDIANSKGIPDGRYGSMVCNLKIGDSDDNEKIMNSIKRFNMSSLKYFTKEDLNILKDIIDDEQYTLELAESIKNLILATTPKSSPEPTYSGHTYGGYVPPEEENGKEKVTGIMGCGVTGTFWGMGHNS